MKLFKEKMNIAIGIPAYNEEKNIAVIITKLKKITDKIIVCDDGSSDFTAKISEELGATVIKHEKNLGYGAAIRSIFLKAKESECDVLVTFDADGQHDAASVVDLTRACDDHSLDLCVGSRFLETLPDGFRSTLLRRVGIRFFCGLLGLLSGVRVTDPTSGLRCAAPAVWRRFARHYPDDYPEPESLFWCLRNRMRIGEIPVRMHSRESGESSIRRVASVYYMTKVTLAVIIDRLRAEEHTVDER